MGTVVTLTGSGFDSPPYTVTVDGHAAASVSTFADSIDFTIAVGTTSGKVVVSDGSNDFEVGLSFEVKRTIDVTLNLPSGVSVLNYELASGTNFVDPVSGSGPHSITVPLDFSGIVWAFRSEEDPVYMAVVTSNDNAVTIDATSTAEGLAFISPLLGTRNDTKTSEIMGLMDGLSELNDLAALIEAHSGDGQDFLDDARVDDALQALLTIVLNPPMGSSIGTLDFEGGTPTGTKLKEINPNFSTTLPATNVRLDSKLKDLSPKNPKDYILEISTIEGKTNPADWAIEVFEVLPNNFENGFDSIDQIKYTDTFDFLEPRPVAVGFKGADLDAAKIDIVEILANLILDKVFPQADEFKPNEFLLPKEIPAVYVAQAYSGNIIYGTRILLSDPPAEFNPDPSVSSNQVDVLNSEDVNSQWEFALASNVIIAAIDVGSVVIDLKDFMKRETLANFIQNVLIDVGKAIQIMQNQGGGLNVENIYLLVRKTAEAVLKAAISEFADAGLSESANRLVKGIGKTFAKAADVTGKISSIGQALERTAGVVTPLALALERSIVVVGDPFNPDVDRISPNIGQEGETVVVSGRNFGFPLPDGQFTEDPNEDLKVEFCQRESSAVEGAPFANMLEAEIERRTNTQILITVPDNFEETFDSGPFPRDIFVCLDKEGSQPSSSEGVGAVGTFMILEPPNILEIRPEIVIRGSIITVRGERFGNKAVAIFDDDPATEEIDEGITRKPIRVEDTFLVVQLPPPSTPGFGDGDHSVIIKRGKKKSGPGMITIGFPPRTPGSNGLPPSGWTINVTSLTDTIGDDGEISVLEAFKYANGELGVPSQNAPCEFASPPDDCPFVPRDTDGIFGDADGEGDCDTVNFPDRCFGGQGFSDSVIVDPPLSGGTANVSEAPAPLDSGDFYIFRGITIDGTAAASGNGLTLNGVVRAGADDVTLRGFPGDGIVLQSSSNNSFDGITIENVGGEGLKILGDSDDNQITDLTVNGVTGNALSISGGSEGNIFLRTAIDTTTNGHGVHISESSFNRFTTTTIANTGGSGFRIEGATDQTFFSNTDQDTFDSAAIEALIPNISDPGAHGVHLLGGAKRSTFRSLVIAGSTGIGVFLEDDASENYFDRLVVKDAALHGVHLSGDSVQFNRFQTHKTGKLSDEIKAAFDLELIILNSGGYGILLDNGADGNVLGPRRIFDSTSGGIRLDGAGTEENFVGKAYNSPPFAPNDILPSLVYNSVGHGIHISNGASRNTIQNLNVSGNGLAPDGVNVLAVSDGVLIEDPNTIGNRVSGVWTGFQYFVFGTGTEPFAWPNTGNSVQIRNGASGNEIGGFSIVRNNLSNDFLNGVLIEGANTMGNIVRDTDIGRTTTTGTFLGQEFAGPGMNGVAIMGGAHDNLIGSRETDLRVSIDASPNAGILIDASDDNEVVGCFFGQPFLFVDYSGGGRNRIGIHLSNGAKGNRIGEIGPLIGPAVEVNLQIDDVVDRTNIIDETSEAGIWIEDSGGTLGVQDARMDPNVFQNVSVESEGIGLRISGNSKVNDIGGFRGGPTGFFLFSEFFTQEDNFVLGKTAGLEIDGVLIANPAERNRFLNNTFSSETHSTNPDPVDQADLTAGPPSGVGVLVKGVSTGNIIGETLRARNFVGNNRVGVYIDGANDNLFRGNEIGNGFSPNNLSGVVIRNGQGNEIGGRSANHANIFGANGLVGFSTVSDNPHASAVLITGGQENIVRNNDILETRGDSVIISNSSNNVIGGAAGAEGNIIADGPFGDASRNGIVIDGAGSSGNIIQSNLIGIDRTGANFGLNINGIEILNGASNNLIGGSGLVGLGNLSINLPAGNVIANSTVHGVRVIGGATVGNSILNNRIYNNGQLGIENDTGGNHELEPPFNMSYGAGSITGSVDVGIPEGSTVDVFSDAGMQGEIYLGSAEVKVDASFATSSLLPAFLSNVTATVTHAGTRSTSEFSLASNLIAFNVTRADGEAPGDQSVSIGSGDLAVLSMQVVAIGADVKVNHIAFEADGTLLDDIQIDGVSLHRDSDGDDQVTERDGRLGEIESYDADNGVAGFDLPGILVQVDDPQVWILVYETSNSVADGITFTAKIASAAAVQAEFPFPIGVNALAVGPFPVASDNFTVGASAGDPQTFADFKSDNFPGQEGNPDVSGEEADPDGDGIPNGAEFLLGTDPNSPDPHDQTEAMIEGGFLVFEFVRRITAVDGTVTVEFSDDLINWGPDPGIITSVEEFSNGDGTSTIRVTTSVQADLIVGKFARVKVTF